MLRRPYMSITTFIPAIPAIRYIPSIILGGARFLDILHFNISFQNIIIINIIWTTIILRAIYMPACTTLIPITYQRISIHKTTTSSCTSAIITPTAHSTRVQRIKHTHTSNKHQNQYYFSVLKKTHMSHLPEPSSSIQPISPSFHYYHTRKPNWLP